MYKYKYININCSSIPPFLRRNKHPSGSCSFAIQKVIKAEAHNQLLIWALSTAPTHILIHQHRHNPKERSHSHSWNDLSFLL